MINNFQKSLSSNKECIWEIVKLFHPDIKKGMKEKIQVYTKYDWVCISTSNNSVDIAIEFECNLMSGSKPLHLFEKELKNNQFRSWRFSSDSMFKLENREEYKYLKNVYNIALNAILNKYNIQKPTAKQMSDFYHSD